jgi:hypothetical protein
MVEIAKVSRKPPQNGLLLVPIAGQYALRAASTIPATTPTGKRSIKQI